MSTPLNLLVIALDGRCDVSCCLLVDACSCLPCSNRCLFVDFFLVFTVLYSSAGTIGDDASLRSTTPSEPDLSTGKDYTLLMIHSISTSGLHASIGEVRCLILPHVYSLFQTDTAMFPPSKPCTAMLLLLVAQPLLSMHA